MKLAQFIQTEMGQLLEDWDEDAKEIAPELKGKDSSALRDHAREMLEFISQDLVTSQTEEESARRTLGKAPFRTPMGRMARTVSNRVCPYSR